MRTKPPCWDDAEDRDCLRRYVGCKAECEKWHKWLAIHESEKAAEEEAKHKQNDVNGFLSQQGKRTRHDNIRKSGEKKRRGIR